MTHKMKKKKGSERKIKSNYCYNICLFQNLVITILKAVGCEDCVQDNNLPLWGPWGKALSRWAIFQKKVAILTPFG